MGLEDDWLGFLVRFEFLIIALENFESVEFGLTGPEVARVTRDSVRI